MSSSEAVYRVFDIALASVGLIVALPLMLATAVVIRLDSPGPVLFRHRRPARSVPRSRARSRGTRRSASAAGRLTIRMPNTGCPPISR